MNQHNKPLNKGARILLGLAAISVLASCYLLGPAFADAPTIITYQGRLKSGGAPVQGSQDMTFRIYEVPTGGVSVFSEAHTAGGAPFVANGLFSAIIGDKTVGGIPASVFKSTATFLEVQIGASTLTPRERITATAYALKAATATYILDNVVTTVKLADGAVDDKKLADAAVTAPKLDVAAAWVLLASHSLTGAATTIDLDNLPVRRFLQVRVFSNGKTSTGITSLRFNNDSGSNYRDDFSAVSLTESQLGTTTTTNEFYAVDIFNLAAQRKMTSWIGSEFVGASSDPLHYSFVGQWNDTTNDITRITLLSDSAGNFNIGSEMHVYGRN
jgi:hypothetical protein